MSRGNSRNGEYALQHCHFLWSQLSDNDDHRIFWGIIVLLGRGTPKNRPTTSWSRLSLETGAILFGYVTYPATKKCPFPSNLLFSYTEKCWNHHHSITISLNIFPRTRCTLQRQVSSSNSSATLSYPPVEEKAPVIHLGIAQNPGAPLCFHTKIRRTWMFIPHRVVPSVFTNPQMYTSHNPFVLLQDVAGAFWPRGQDGPQEKPEFPVASQAPRLAPLTLANRRCSRQIFFMGKKIQ